MLQKTIINRMPIEGAGIHTGRTARVTLCPAEAGAGIVFKRTDLPENPSIRLSAKTLLSSARCTEIGYEDVSVKTVEHFAAALAGLGIDNITVEIDGEEMPALGGGSAEYADIILKCGIAELKEEKSITAVKEPMWIYDQDKSVVALPSDKFIVTVMLSFDSFNYFGDECLTLEINPETFLKEIAPARTFCFEEEIEGIRQSGLGKGGNTSNTLVISRGKPAEFLLPKEPARHKILDFIGDLAVLSVNIRGHFILNKPGHALNHKIIAMIDERAFKVRKIREGKSIPNYGKTVMNINDIKKILPHRYPFLLVDKIIDITPGQKIVGVKNLTANEEFFNGHYPGRPIMPGVLIIEAMAQTGGLLVLSERGTTAEAGHNLVYFIGIDNVKFRQLVVPGDQLILEVEIIKVKKKLGTVRGAAYVDSNLVCEAEMKFYLVD